VDLLLSLDLGLLEVLDVRVVHLEDGHLRGAGRATRLVPAEASAPRMKETGPEALPPGGQQLLGGATGGRRPARARRSRCRRVRRSTCGPLRPSGTSSRCGRSAA
jgi:hypothetical protein